MGHTNPITQRTLAGTTSMAADAEKRVDEKQVQYEDAKTILCIFQSKKRALFSQLQGNSNRKDLKNKYTQFCNSVRDAEINVDVSRGSLENSLSWSSKLNNSSYIANSILA